MFYLVYIKVKKAKFRFDALHYIFYEEKIFFSCRNKKNILHLHLQTPL